MRPAPLLYFFIFTTRNDKRIIQQKSKRSGRIAATRPAVSFTLLSMSGYDYADLIYGFV